MKLWSTLILLFACLSTLQSQQSPLVSDENKILELALFDLRTIPIEEQCYIRYVWITSEENETHECVQAVALTLNYISKASVIIRPLPISKNLVRIDLRNYGDENLVKAWEEFQYDPKFNILATKDTIKFTNLNGEFGRIIDVPPYVHTDGKTYTKKRVDVDVIRSISPHLNRNLIVPLIDATRSQAPIVNHRYFISRALTTIKDKGLFKVIYGGLYYDLSGIGTNFQKGTDEDNLYEKLGVGNVQQGINAKKIFDQLRSDQRVAVFRSSVTGRPRRVDFLRSLASRDSQSVLSVTHDIKSQDIDIGTHAIMNLLDFKDQAREVIFEKATGLHGFALFNGDGKRQDEVPPDIAADYTIPIPYGNRLQPAIGCIRCHKTDRGWQPVTNDVKKLLSSYVDIFDDKSEHRRSIPDTLDRLAGLYAGDPEFKLLLRARDDYTSSMLKATGPWQKSKDQTDIVRLATERLAEIYRSYNYDMIDAEKAIRELGYGHQENAVEFFKKLIPPPKIVIDGVIPEDPRIAALMTGLSINRSDWDLVYSIVATRKGENK